MRFHVVALPHTEVKKEYSSCAYTQKVLNFCKMMKARGHTVFLYGGGDTTEAPCDEFISIVSPDERKEWFGVYDWHKEMFRLDWNPTLHYWVIPNARATEEIAKRKEQKDILCMITSNQMQIANAHPDLLSVEFGVGYEGILAKNCVFESYAWMHHVYGIKGMRDGRNYDAVIPNYFDPEDFPYLGVKSNYVLYIGRLISRKGVNIAIQAAAQLDIPIKIAGQGVINYEPGKLECDAGTFEYPKLEYVGHVSGKERAELMGKAQAVLVPTQYIEPFGGVAVEAMMCGTPVITTDWGAFTETVIDGVTGFRTRTMAEITHAIEHSPHLDPVKIRDYAIKNYSLVRVSEQYEAYFQGLLELWEEGWYSQKDLSEFNRYKKY